METYRIARRRRRHPWQWRYQKDTLLGKRQRHKRRSTSDILLRDFREKIFMLDIYPKNEKPDLDAAQLKEISNTVKERLKE